MLGMIGRFLLIFVLMLGALTALWGTIAPAYTWAAATLVGPAFRLVESPNVTSVEARGDELWILREIADGRSALFTWFDRFAFFAAIPLLALLVATPGLGLLARLVRIGVGLVALLFVHVAYLVASIELSYAAIGLLHVGPLAARMLDAWQILVRILWEAAPILIFVACTLGAWKRTFERLRATTQGSELPRHARGRGVFAGLGWKEKEGTS